MATLDLNAFPQHPICGFCSDRGVTLDQFNGYRWCKCPAGMARLVAEPGIVDEANASRQKVGV